MFQEYSFCVEEQVKVISRRKLIKTKDLNNKKIVNTCR